MDLSIVTDGWEYDEDDEAQNVRKVVGVDGRMKVQLRLRSGLIQWELEGRPDGRSPFGQQSMLQHCCRCMEHWAGDAPERAEELTRQLEGELIIELLDYHRRCRALFHLGDYRRALNDSLHCLEILDLMREHCSDGSLLSYDRYRPALLVDRSRAEMLLCIQQNDMRGCVDALSRGIEQIERFYRHYEMDEEIAESAERQVLVDLRRSLREKHNIPLNDKELLRSLRTEQEIAIRKENYEMAARLRDKIQSLKQRLGKAD
ncbi:MAG: UvrB/UvrC motif-containing protein [Planctomycetota bacterium]